MSESEYKKSVTASIRFALEEADLVHVINRIDMAETVKLELVDGMWHVTNPDGSPNWIGKHAYKNGAVLEYLKRRLGIYEEDEMKHICQICGNEE